MQIKGHWTVLFYTTKKLEKVKEIVMGWKEEIEWNVVRVELKWAHQATEYFGFQIEKSS